MEYTPELLQPTASKRSPGSSAGKRNPTLKRQNTESWEAKELEFTEESTKNGRCIKMKEFQKFAEGHPLSVQLSTDHHESMDTPLGMRKQRGERQIYEIIPSFL